MNTPKIKLQRINSGETKVFSVKQKKYLPDNYYTYDIHRHLKTDFHNAFNEADRRHFCLSLLGTCLVVHV